MSYEIRMILFLGIFIVASLCLFDLLVDYLLVNYRGGILRVMMRLMMDSPFNYWPSQDEEMLQALCEPLS
ncbi:hypothetical protein [Plesiomonas shigelloides]|uniref:hypothetical protein n=1 Tax=Plesiomonas shigelloides TaxID=703 RepID=UPI0012629BDA|nr:hypothetical protein [Plesiomonas shigelloides]KAB7692291.1 hypothetical protein GBN28_02705 [Plesiomonas shigelloides]